MANVLLIEPDAALGRTYKQALQHAGHTVGLATSAQEAVDTADELRPDVVVLELQLAVHNGVEFLYEFRSYPEWQQIPIVVNTQLTPDALALVQEVLEQELGVRLCLYKPRTSLEQLLGAVRRQVQPT
jgi:DNA-binding response OmpR family regulator